MATYSSILAWVIPWTEEPGGLQSMVSQSWTQLSDLTFTYDYTVETRNKFKGLDLIECLMNYGWRLMTL